MRISRLFCLVSLAVLAVVLVVVNRTTAGDCGVVRQRVVVANHGHVAAVNHHVAAVKVIDHIAVAVPLYGAVYGGYGNGNYGDQQAKQQDDASKQLLEKLIQEIQGLRSDIQSGVTSKQEAADTLSANAASDARSTVSLLQSKCAKCHAEGSAKGDLEMFSKEGEPFKLSGVAKREIIKRVKNGTMPPPPGKMTAQDKAVIEAAYK